MKRKSDEPVVDLGVGVHDWVVLESHEVEVEYRRQLQEDDSLFGFLERAEAVRRERRKWKWRRRGRGGIVAKWLKRKGSCSDKRGRRDCFSP